METNAPRAWKMLLVTWVCIYPLLNILLFLTAPFVGNLHPLLRTFVLSLVLVPLMSVSLRTLQGRLHPWLVR